MQCVFMYIHCSRIHWFRKKPLYGANQAPSSCILIAGWLFESPSSWLLATAHELQPTRYLLAQALVFLEQFLCCTSCNYKINYIWYTLYIACYSWWKTFTLFMDCFTIAKVFGDVCTWILWKLVKAGNCECFGNEGKDMKQQKFLTTNNN